MDTIKAIERIVTEATVMKNAYYFRPAGIASQRRIYEERHSHPRIDWVEGGHGYSAEYKVTCTCSNVYAIGLYYRDGKKTTLTAIKNSLKRLQAKAEQKEGNNGK